MKLTPWQKALVAYAKAAGLANWTNEQFMERVQSDFNVSPERAKSFLIMLSFGRPEEWTVLTSSEMLAAAREAAKKATS